MSKLKKTATPRCRILIMEEDPVICKFMTRLFARTEIETVSVSDPESAVCRYRAAQNSGQAFDAVILDLNFEGQTIAPQVLERLKEIDSQVKAVVSSGDHFHQVLLDHEKYGFKGKLKKPSENHELLSIVSAVINTA